MKIHSLSALILLSFVGCARIPSPSFEMTNSMILEKTLKEVNISNMISSSIPPGSTVALLPVANKDIDIKDFYMIEDNLTQQLLLGGYAVKQKPDALTVSAAGEVSHTGSSVTVEGSISADGQIQVIKQDASATIAPSNWDYIKAIMPNVDAYIVYNVHEYGLIYIPNENAMKMITREFRVKMTVRIVRSKDLSILAVKDYNAHKSDDIHQSTLNALNNYTYQSNSFSFPLLGEPGEAQGKWLNPSTHDWDFVFLGGLSFPNQSGALRAGIDSDFGRLMINANAFDFIVDYDGDTDNIDASGLFGNMSLSVTYMRRIKNWNKVSLLAGGGILAYVGPDIPVLEGMTVSPKLYGIQGSGELEYTIYRGNQYKININAGVMLNLVIPYIKEIETKDLEVSMQVFSPYVTAGVNF